MTAIAAYATPADTRAGMGFKQFVALVAALMAVNALAVDSMLPALPAIGQSQGKPAAMDRHLLSSGLRRGTDSLWYAGGPIRTQKHPAPGPWHLCRVEHRGDFRAVA
jgi:hypothetical protein